VQARAQRLMPSLKRGNEAKKKNRSSSGGAGDVKGKEGGKKRVDGDHGNKDMKKRRA